MIAYKIPNGLVKSVTIYGEFTAGPPATGRKPVEASRIPRHPDRNRARISHPQRGPTTMVFEIYQPIPLAASHGSCNWKNQGVNGALIAFVRLNRPVASK